MTETEHGIGAKTLHKVLMLLQGFFSPSLSFLKNVAWKCVCKLLTVIMSIDKSTGNAILANGSINMLLGSVLL